MLVWRVGRLDHKADLVASRVHRRLLMATDKRVLRGLLMATDRSLHRVLMSMVRGDFYYVEEPTIGGVDVPTVG